MLEYKITPADVIMCTVKDPLLLVVVATVYLILGIYFFRMKAKKIRLIILAFLVALPVLSVSPTLIKTLSGWDWYGYELHDHELHIKAWPVDEFVDLNNSTVFLTKSNDWRPKIRVFGTGMETLGMGYFKLGNGVKAVVFRHKDSKEIVVINASGRYYVIIHPGVEKLYEEITKIKKGI